MLPALVLLINHFSIIVFVILTNQMCKKWSRATVLQEWQLHPMCIWSLSVSPALQANSIVSQFPRLLSIMLSNPLNSSTQMSMAPYQFNHVTTIVTSSHSLMITHDSGLWPHWRIRLVPLPSSRLSKHWLKINLEALSRHYIKYDILYSANKYKYYLKL